MAPHEISRRGLLKYSAFGVGTALLLSACSANEPEGSKKPDNNEIASLTFVTPFGFLVGFTAALVAKSGGFFEKENLDVKIEGGAGSAQALQQVLSGQAFISRTGGGDLINAVANKKTPLVSVATISQRSPFDLISSAAEPIKSAEDMRGKSIGIIAAGGADEYLLKIALNEAGIPFDSVREEVVGNAPGAFALVEKGTIAAFFATSGTRRALELEGANVSYVSTDTFAPIPGQALIMQRDEARERGHLVERYLRAIHKAMTFVLDDEAKGWGQTISYLREWDIAGIESDERAIAELEVTTKQWTGPSGAILRNDPAHWSNAQELMASAGLIEAPVDGGDLYTNEYVDRAMQ